MKELTGNFEHDLESVEEIVRVQRATDRLLNRQDLFFETLHQLITELKVHRQHAGRSENTIRMLKSTIGAQETRIKSLQENINHLIDSNIALEEKLHDQSSADRDRDTL